ncbi:hypothetical protein DMENIID0001_114060 [Sergentomyia squamirostris]
MTVTKALGISFKLQEYFTLANYEDKSWTLRGLVRMIPIFTCTAIAIFEISVIFFIPRFPHVEDITIVSSTVAKLDFVVNRLGLLLLFIMGFIRNSDHLNFYTYLLTLAKKLPIPVTDLKRRIFRNNVEILFCLTINTAITWVFFVIDSETYDFKAVIMHIIYIVTLCATDSFSMYIIYLYKEFSALGSRFRSREFSSGEEIASLTLLAEILNIPVILNTALGGLTFISVMQHLVCSSLTSYLIFWVFDMDMPPMVLVIYSLACFIWMSRSSACIIYLSISGNDLSNEIQELLKHINYIDEGTTDHCVLFNQDFTLLWSHHVERRIMAGSSIEINNSGIFSFVMLLLESRSQL